MTHEPRYDWQLDWNQDGNFNHPLSSLEEDQITSSLRRGSAADTPQSRATQPGTNTIVQVPGILSDYAQGQVDVYDRDGRFDPDFPGLRINEVTLRSPVNARLMIDGVEEWRGRAIPRYGTSFSTLDNFQWKLEGLHAEAMRSQIVRLERPGTVSGITDDDVPVSYTNPGEDMPLGLVTFNGTRIRFHEQAARMAGGWMVESDDGTWQLHTLIGAHSLPPVVTLSDEFEPISGVHVAEHRDLVWNSAVMVAREWTPLLDEVGQRRIVSVGTVNHQFDEISRVFTFRMKPEDTRRIDRWEDPSITNGRVQHLASSESGRWIRYRAIPGGTGPFSVSVRAQISVVDEVARDEDGMNITSSQRVYGRRDLGLPPWFTPNLDGSEKVTHRYIEAIAEPVRYFRITFPEWQRTKSLFDQLRLARPGAVVNLFLTPKRGDPKLEKCLVLAIRHKWGRGQLPTRTLFGVVTRATAPAPLRALEAYATSAFDGEAILRSTLTDGRDVWLSVERA